MIMRQTRAELPPTARSVQIVPIIATATDEAARVQQQHGRECGDQANPPWQLAAVAVSAALLSHFAPRPSAPPPTLNRIGGGVQSLFLVLATDQVQFSRLDLM